MLGAFELGRLGGSRLRAMIAVLVVFEALAVLVLRAHYTMDVFTGAVTALVVAAAAARLAPACDAVLCRVAPR